MIEENPGDRNGGWLKHYSLTFHVAYKIRVVHPLGRGRDRGCQSHAEVTLDASRVAHPL